MKILAYLLLFSAHYFSVLILWLNSQLESLFLSANAPKSMRVLLVIWLTAGIGFVGANPEKQADKLPPGYGLQDVNEKVYADNCAACHGHNFAGGPLGVSLLHSPLVHGNELEQVIVSIRDGFPEQGMPAWKDVQSESQIRRLAMLILERQAGFTYDSVDPLGEVFVAPGSIQETEHHRFILESVTGDLQHPFSIAPLPDGRILYTEKSVGLSLLSADGKTKTLIKGTPRVYDTNTLRGGALIGSGWMQEVALHPKFGKNGWIYLSYGDRCSDCNALSKSTGKPVTMLVIVRGKIENNRWVDEQTLWRADIDHYRTGHNQALGARLSFDNKGHLFFSMGGLSGEEGIQDLNKPYGKIFRIDDDGGIPKSNPFIDKADAIPSIWSYGHRNPQGLDYNTKTRSLWSTEHGPRGGDELNLIEPANNYGWPMVSYGIWYDGKPISFAKKLGIQFDPSELTYPAAHWTPSPGISSLVFYDGKRFPKWKNDLLVSTMRKQRLMRLVIEQGKVVSEEVILDQLGRFRDIEVGPNGDIYLLIEQFYGSHIVRMREVD